MEDEQITLTVTTNNASETVIINNDPPAPVAQSKPTKGAANENTP